MKRFVLIISVFMLIIMCSSFSVLAADASSSIRGDFNEDDSIDANDAIYLLYYVFFSDNYPISQDGDLNNDDRVDSSDAIYMLYHVFFGDNYPLHSLSTIPAVAPTCTEVGYTEGMKCSKCNEILKAPVEIPATGHNEVIDEAIAPDCVNAGKTEGKHCSVCGEVLVAQNDIDPLGHDPVIDPAVEPSCIKTGLTEGKHCSVCGEVLVAQNDIDPLGHDPVIDPAVEPSCIKTGLTEGKHCSVCGELLIAQVIIEMIDHSMVDGVCSVCGYGEIDFSNVELYESDYGYNYLGTLTNGEALQTYYDRLDAEARDFHTDSSRNATTPSQYQENQMLLPSTYYNDLGLTYDEAKLVMLIFKYDRPLYYWITNSWTYNASYGWIALQVENDYANGKVRAEYNAMVYEAVKEYYSVVADEESEYYIALAYHDMILSSIDYVYESDGVTPEDARWAHSIIGVFNGRGVVCEGYSRAFQLLLNLSDIENLYVSGYANGSHGWSLVRLDDGEWYWFDLTWNDTPNSFRGIRYNYFAISDTTVVDWSDAHLGWQEPQKGGVEFLENHTPYEGDGMHYVLPERADDVFSNENILEIRERFTVDGNTYALVGYNKVQLVASNARGAFTVPGTVTYNGRDFDVVAIGAMDEEGYFVEGRILANDTVEELTVSGSVINIDMYAFGKNFAIKKAVLLDGVKSIDHFAFWNCYSMTEVEIPNTVKTIGIQAFAYCYSLESIHFNGTVAEWNDIEKGNNWSQECKSLVIHCSDGDIIS